MKIILEFKITFVVHALFSIRKGRGMTLTTEQDLLLQVIVGRTCRR